MDIMELGAIGELVGGVAVATSLTYVGVPVRETNQHSRRRLASEDAPAPIHETHPWCSAEAA